MNKRHEDIGQNDPLVSVVVLTYQHAPYIRSCLDGILMQKTDFDFEVIVGEDDSSDGTREICVDYANNYPDKIRLFLRSRKDVLYINGKATGRYNFTQSVKASRGSYIALCPGDDYWSDPHKLQKQISEMGRHPDCAMSFHPVIQTYVDGSNKDRIIKRHSKNKRVFTASEVIMSGGLCPSASMVMRREVIANLPKWFYTEAPVGDIYLEVFAALSGGLLYIDEVMAVRRLKVPLSWSSRRMVESSDDSFWRARRHEELFKLIDNSTDNQYTFEINQMLARHYYTLAVSFLRKRQSDKFVKSIERSWSLAPNYCVKQAILFFFRRIGVLIGFIVIIKSYLRKD